MRCSGRTPWAMLLLVFVPGRDTHKAEGCFRSLAGRVARLVRGLVAVRLGLEARVPGQSPNPQTVHENRGSLRRPRMQRRAFLYGLAAVATAGPQRALAQQPTKMTRI